MGRATEVIETGCCLLELLTRADRTDLASLYMDKGVRRYLGGVVVGRDFDDCFDRMLEDRQAKNWTVWNSEDRGFVGLLSLACHHDGQDFEISYQISPSFWGRGYAFEAVAALTRHAITALELPRLVAETQAANVPSRRLLERLGMSPLRTVWRFGAEQIIYGADADDLAKV